MICAICGFLFFPRAHATTPGPCSNRGMTRTGGTTRGVALAALAMAAVVKVRGGHPFSRPDALTLGGAMILGTTADTVSEAAPILRFGPP